MDADRRVVVVSQHYPPDKSGNASRIRDTCVHLDSEGWDVTVLAPPPAFPHGRFDRSWVRKSTSTDEGVHVNRLWAWQPTEEDPGFISRMAYYLLFPLHALLWLLVNYRKYDAIMTSSPPIFTGLAGLPFGLLGLKPWIVDVRDLWIDASVGLGFITKGGVLERISRRYQQLVLYTADRVTVTTKVLGQRLSDQYGLPAEAIVHLPNGVDTDYFTPGEDTETPLIVYTGNVGHAQDLERVVKAMALIDRPDVELRIVGDGDIRPTLEAITKEHGLEDTVVFTGLVPRDSIPSILQDAWIGVAPLKSEETLEYAVPTKAYEYMSAGVPVVATGIGEIEELVDASGGGVFVENDVERLARTFSDLLEDPAYRSELGENGRTHVQENYDRRIIVQRLAQELQEITDEP